MNELGAILEKDKLMDIAAEEYRKFRGTDARNEEYKWDQRR